MINSKKVDISVIMPAYNCGPYIGEAVSSILSQTVSNIELIIVDDCSTDATRSILDNINDDRIVRINNPKNLGVICSRNIAIRRATGNFVALMDSDDVSDFRRLEHQQNFLIQNPRVDAVGTAIIIIDEVGARYSKYLFPELDSEIFPHLHIGFPFANPSLMFRSEVFKDGGSYLNIPENYVEDYEFMARKIDSLRFANIKLPLLYLRKHKKSYSRVYETSHVMASVNISHNLLELRLKHPIQRDIVNCIHSFGRRSPEYGGAAVEILVELFYVLKNSPRISTINSLRGFIAMRIFLVGFFSSNLLSSFSAAFKIDPFFILKLVSRLLKRGCRVCEV